MAGHVSRVDGEAALVGEAAAPGSLDFSLLPLTLSRLKPVPHVSAASGTGFIREEASPGSLDFSLLPLTPSRLKPVPQLDAVSGTGFSREASRCGLRNHQRS
jgi:hypothetical protein